jgi:hypothetical protein
VIGPIFYGYGLAADGPFKQPPVEKQEESIKNYLNSLSNPPIWGGLFADSYLAKLDRPLFYRKAGSGLNVRVRRGDHVCFMGAGHPWRGSKDMLNCFRLWRWRGITIHFQEERLALAPDDKMFALLIGATEQCIDIDKQLRQERAAQSAAGRRARGETLGPAPWGFRLYCTRLVPDEKEQQILAYIRHLREIEKLSQSETALRLQTLQVPTKHRYGQWSQTAAIRAYDAALRLGLEPGAEIPSSAKCCPAMREKFTWRPEE